MAIAIVQAKEFSRESGGGAVTTLSGNLASAVTAGNRVVFLCWTGYPSTDGHVTAFDANGQGASLLNTGDVTHLAIGDLKSATGGSTAVQMTMLSRDDYVRFWAVEISGSDATSNITLYQADAYGTYGTGTDAMKLTAMSVAAIGDMLLGISYNNDNTSVPAVGTGYTNVLSSTFSGDCSRIEYKIAVATGSQQIQWTQSDGVNHMLAGVVVPQAAGGGGGLFVNPMTGRGGAASRPIAA